MKKNTGNLKMKNLKPYKELLSSYKTHFLKKHFPIDESHCFNGTFDEKRPITLILGVFSSPLPDMNAKKFII